MDTAALVLLIGIVLAIPFWGVWKKDGEDEAPLGPRQIAVVFLVLVTVLVLGHIAQVI